MGLEGLTGMTRLANNAVDAMQSADWEIASHGLEHRQVDRQGAESFRRDTYEAKAILEDLSGQEVLGFRAASFSMNGTTPWAHDILKEVGYRYSSSIYPIRHDLYGQPDAPRFAYHPSGDDGVVEDTTALEDERPRSGEVVELALARVVVFEPCAGDRHGR